MDKIEITGGQRLEGEVRISGSKNSALPILAATLLGKGDQHITNIPDLRDVSTIIRLLTRLGVQFSSEADGLTVNAGTLTGSDAPYELVKTMRASVLVLGPLLARLGQARVSLPGGCAIGARPVNLHLMGFEKMGCEIKIRHGYIQASVPKSLKGTKIRWDIPTVTGTENLMMAATLAEGTTVLENAAREPEVADLAQFLRLRGAKIHGEGTDRITIEGVSKLHPADYRVMPDRIETATYAAAAAITQGDLYLRHCIPSQLDAVTAKLREAGAEVREEDGALRVRCAQRPKPVDLTTQPYPGFPTDMQSPAWQGPPSVGKSREKCF